MIWDEAEVATLGRVDRPSAALSYPIPIRVETDAPSGRMLWAWGPVSERPRQPALSLLTDFVGLVDAPADRLLSYARRWGVLEICEHELPTSHNLGQPISPPGGAVTWCVALGRYDRLEQPEAWWDGWAPLTAWHFWSRQARAILNVAAEAHLDRSGSVADWKTIYEASGRDWIARDSTGARVALGHLLQEWLVLADVRPRVAWPASGPSMRLGGRGLFGAIAMQLLLSAWNTKGLAICSACGNPYAPRRRPAREGRHFCEDCRQQGEHKRAAARDYERRQREEQR